MGLSLNSQFQSVFTEDSENIMPEIGGKKIQHNELHKYNT
jgi:hypothetical protein